MRIAYCLIFVLFTVFLTGCDGPRERRIKILDKFEARIKNAIDEKVLQDWANDAICKYNVGDSIPEETFPSCFTNVMDHGYQPYCYLIKSTEGDKCLDITWRWFYGQAGIVIGVENKELTVDWLKDGIGSRYLSMNLIIYIGTD